MPIIITDEDAQRLLSIPEAIEAMHVAFRDLAEGRAVNPPRLRYAAGTPDPTRRYMANIHAGAIESYAVACVRAGSHFAPTENNPQRKAMADPAAVNWSIIILYDLNTGEPLAFMHETHLSGFRVGATSALGVAEAARADASVLGLYGTGNQAFPNCRAICAVRPIKRVQVFSPSPAHRAAFVQRMAGEKVEVVPVDDPRDVVRGAHIVCCATNSKQPVLDGDWLEPGQMVITIANSDVINTRREVDEKTFARASDIIINDWDSVSANRQVELTEPIEKGLVARESVHTLGDLVAGKAKLRGGGDGIVYYKNNTGLAMQFAACGAILYRKLMGRHQPDDPARMVREREVSSVMRNSPEPLATVAPPLFLSSAEVGCFRLRPLIECPNSGIPSSGCKRGPIATVGTRIALSVFMGSPPSLKLRRARRAESVEARRAKTGRLRGNDALLRRNNELGGFLDKYLRPSHSVPVYGVVTRIKTDESSMSGVEGSSARAVGAPGVDGCVRTQRASLRALLVIGGVIAAIWLLAASRWIVTDTVVPWDSKNQFYAFFRFLASALDSGASPFWNPYHYGGHPSVADPQSLIFAPLFLLWALFDSAPSLRAFDLVVFAHLLLGGIAIGIIGWRARWPVAACVLAAALFMLGGAAAGRLQHTGLILSYGFFPPALLLLQLALERRSIPLAAGFAFVASALALGRNQVAMLLGFVLIAVAVAEIVTAERPARYLRERLGVFVTMGVIGFVLVAAPLLLTMQFAALSNRPVVLLDNALKGSLYPAGLAQLLVANIFGSHRTDYWGPNGATEPAVAFTDDSFNYLFVGSVPLVLLLWFGVAGGGALRRGRLLITGVLVAALIYALGRYTPLFALAFDWVPGVSRFRRPVDADFVLVAALALLAGHLLADYVREGLPRARAIALAAVIIAVGAVLASAVMFSARSGHGHDGDALLAILKTAPITLAVIAMLALPRTAHARAVAAVLVTVVAVAELTWWNAAFRLNAEERETYAVLDRPASGDAQVIDVIERAVRERHRAGERPRVEIIGMGGPWQNLAMVRGLEATNGYNPLRIGYYDRLVAPGEANWMAELRDFPASFDGYDCALARTLGLEFVVLDRRIEEVPHLARRPVADVLQWGPNAWIYRLRNPAPRVKFTRRIQVADADATGGSGQLLVSPAPDRVLIDDDTPPAKSYAAAAETDTGAARMVSWRPDRVEIEVDSTLGGMLALHDTYYPGWIAEIDGTRARILRADVLFRGVEVPAGRHRVVFRFAPFALDNLIDALKLAVQRHQ